jgi:hypothetical protein
MVRITSGVRKDIGKTKDEHLRLNSPSLNIKPVFSVFLMNSIACSLFRILVELEVLGGGF